MRSVFGASRSGEPVGGSASKTSIAGAARGGRSPSAVGDGRLVDDPAAGDVEEDRAGLHPGDAPSRPISPRGRPRQRDVDRDDVGPGERGRRTTTSSTPWCAACSAVTNGSEPRTVISIARARAAIAWPILPSPTMPSVRPRSSRPVNWARFHSPRRTDASAAAILRATPYSRASVCSAAAIVLPVGALTTVIPAARRRLEVDVVDADPGPADDLEARARRRRSRRRPGPGSGRRARRTRAGSRRARRGDSPGRSSTSCCAAEAVDALRGDGLGDEDPHAGTPAPASIAARCR